MNKSTKITVDELNNLTDVSDRLKQHIIAKVDAQNTYIEGYFEKWVNNQQDWLCYTGDLVIDKAFYANKHFVVDGNLTIKGDCETNTDLDHALIITGDLTADNLVDHQTIYFGDLTVDGLRYESKFDHMYGRPKGAWTSTQTLISEDSNITELPNERRKAIIEQLEAKQKEAYHFEVSLLRLQDEDYQWHLHEGDLTIDKHFHNNSPFIVTGNLTVNGVYLDDYKHLLVFGNLQANHIISEGSMTITGNTNVEGLLCNHYNDNVFECHGLVSGKAHLIIDKDTRCYGNEKFDFTYDWNYSSGNEFEEVFVSDVIDNSDEEYISISVDSLMRKLGTSKEIFKADWLLKTKHGQ